MTETKNRWVWEAQSKKYTLRELNPPTPPSEEEIISHFLEDGEVDRAIGEFVTEMLNQGYTITILDYGVDAHAEVLRRWSTGGYVDHYYAECRTHTSLWVDFQSDPECFLVESPLTVLPSVIFAIGVAIAVIISGAGVFYALQNLTTTKKTYEKWEWVQNPDTEEWEWKRVEKKTVQEPPTDLWVKLAIVAMIGIIVIVAIGALKK